MSAAVHCVIANAEPGKVGYVKLNKILWYADLEHYRWHGESVTGLRHYARTLQGPMAPEIAQAVRQLVKVGKVAEREINVADYIRRDMISLQPPEVSALSDTKSGILKQMIRIIAPLSATAMRQMTHGDPLWHEVGNGEAMLIATASLITPRLPAATTDAESREA